MITNSKSYIILQAEKLFDACQNIVTAIDVKRQEDKEKYCLKWLKWHNDGFWVKLGMMLKLSVPYTIEEAKTYYISYENDWLESLEPYNIAHYASRQRNLAEIVSQAALLALKEETNPVVHLTIEDFDTLNLASWYGP